MFQIPLAITGTEAQLNALLPKLEALGYQKSTSDFVSYSPLPSTGILVTNLNDESGQYSFTYYENRNLHNRTQVSANNEPLVLALAAMREGSTFYPGEAVMLNAMCNGELKEGLYIIESIDSDPEVPYPLYLVGGGAWDTNNRIRKAQKEEIIAHYTKQQPTMPIDKPYTNTNEVTYEMVTTHPYFQTLTLGELKNVLNRMNTNGYMQLPGKGAQNKAYLLQESWKAPVYNSYAVYAHTYTEAEALTAYQEKLFGGCETAHRYTYYRFSLDDDPYRGHYGRANHRDVYTPDRPAKVEHIFDSFQDWKAYIARIEGKDYTVTINGKEVAPRKLVGYKAPIDLFNGMVSKGSIFEEDSEFFYTYKPKGQSSVLHKLPKEIVEVWEPVYEEEKLKELTLTVGNPAIEIKINREGVISISKHDRTVQMDVVDYILKVLHSINTKTEDPSNSITLKGALLHFGCSNGTDISYSELLKIKQAFTNTFKA